VSSIDLRRGGLYRTMTLDASPDFPRPLTKQITNAKTKDDFNFHAFFSTIGTGRERVSFNKEDVIFSQGDSTDGLYFVQKGKVKLSVVSEAGKEATLGIMSEDDFFGEGGLAGQLSRMASATAMSDCSLLHIEKKAMMRALAMEPKLSAMFVQYLLQRNVRYQDDLIVQLFNSSEKRLARVLLLMAHFDKEGTPETVVPIISQETLAEMVGTTRSRVSFFMNRFKRQGFVKYDMRDNLQVNSSLLNVVLHDDVRNMFKGMPGNETEPPSEPGERPDKERAKGPLIFPRPE
jgi:CRP/FNR family transcriptional regulator, cyclic AMP receptor protein